MKSKLVYFTLWLVFLAPLAVSADETRIYADNFRWGTAAQGFWFSHNISSAGAAWSRANGALENSNGSAVNSSVIKSFNPVTLSQPGDYIRLTWEYRSLVKTDRQGSMQVGLWHLGAAFLANEFGTALPVNNRRGMVLLQNHSQDFSYVRYFPGSGTDSSFLPDPQTGSQTTPTGRIDNAVFRPCELLLERRESGVWVSGRINGISIPARPVPDSANMTVDAIRVLGQYGGSDSPRHSSIRNVELSVPEHLLPTPIWDSYDWSQATELSPGVLHAKFSITTPRLMALNIARIDLRNPNLRLYSTPRASGYVEGSRETLLRRTTGFMSDAQAAGKPLVLAINADFFEPVSSEGTPANLLHVAYSDGVQVSPQRTGATAPALVFFKDWTADLIDVGPTTDLSNFLQAVGAFGWVLDGHVPTGSTSPTEPRTAAGVSIDRRYVYFLTVDGRRSGHSDGATIFELGELLRYFGAHAGFNLDGGGSTTMVRWNGSPQILNTPSDQNTFFGIPIGGSVERPVGNHIGVYSITVPEQVPMDDWLAARDVPANLRGPLDEPSGQGISNLFAYAFNIHPMQPNFPFGREALPQWTPERNIVRYTYRANRHAVGLNYFLEHSTTLAPGRWNVLPSSAIEMLGTPDPRTGDTYFRTTITPGTGNEFLRMRIQGNN